MNQLLNEGHPSCGFIDIFLFFPLRQRNSITLFQFTESYKMRLPKPTNSLFLPFLKPLQEVYSLPFGFYC